MTDYRRRKIPGATYFFTIVAQDRQPILNEAHARFCLKQAIRHVQSYRPFRVEAIVLLPEHIHTIWSLPDGDFDFSGRWNWIKRKFTQKYSQSGCYPTPISLSKKKKRVCGIWQRRFWEHCIQDDTDFIRHLDYIHYNPVKHGLVAHPREWLWSTFHRYVRL